MVPDIGDFKDVAVIEVLVEPAGDTIKAEQSLITVESDKASMEIPSSASAAWPNGSVKVGDTVDDRRRWSAALEGTAQALPHRVASARCAAGTCARRRQRARRQASRCRGCAATPGNAPRQCHVPHAIAVGAQVRPRTGRAAGRSRRQRPQRPHHAGRRAGLHQGGDGGHGANQGDCGVGQAGGRRGRGPGPAALAQGGLRQVRPRRAQGPGRASRRSAAPTCTATGC